MTTKLSRRLLAGLALIVAAGLPVPTVSARAAASAANTATAQAASVPAVTATTQCSGWSASIPALRYRDCLVPLDGYDGEFVRTGLQVINATHTERWVTFVQKTVIGGQVKGTANCKVKVQPGDSAVVTCWEPSPDTYRLIPFGSYGYGTGTVTDNSSGLTSTASSPVFDLR